MAEDVTIRVAGLSRLRRDLKAAGEDISDLKDVHAQVGALVLPEAERRAPRGPSRRLAASGRASRAVGRITLLFGGASVPYAGPIHWGWPRRGITAQPFAADAAAALEPQWLDLYLRGMDEALGRHIESVY